MRPSFISDHSVGANKMVDHYADAGKMAGMDKAPTILCKMKKMQSMTHEASGLVFGLIDDIYKPDCVPDVERKTANPTCIDEEMDYMIESMGELIFFLKQLRERI